MFFLVLWSISLFPLATFALTVEFEKEIHVLPGEVSKKTITLKSFMPTTVRIEMIGENVDVKYYDKNVEFENEIKFPYMVKLTKNGEVGKITLKVYHDGVVDNYNIFVIPSKEQVIESSIGLSLKEKNVELKRGEEKVIDGKIFIKGDEISYYLTSNTINPLHPQVYIHPQVVRKSGDVVVKVKAFADTEYGHYEIPIYAYDNLRKTNIKLATLSVDVVKYCDYRVFQDKAFLVDFNHGAEVYVIVENLSYCDIPISLYSEDVNLSKNYFILKKKEKKIVPFHIDGNMESVTLSFISPELEKKIYYLKFSKAKIGKDVNYVPAKPITKEKPKANSIPQKIDIQSVDIFVVLAAGLLVLAILLTYLKSKGNL